MIMPFRGAGICGTLAGAKGAWNCRIALPHAILSVSLIVPPTLGRNAVTHRAPRKARNQMCPLR
jgi:hypothetical protein